MFVLLFQAYRQSRSSAVQVARIVAVTVVAASAILGACLLASAWIQARATCELMVMEHQLHEAELRMQAVSVGASQYYWTLRRLVT